MQILALETSTEAGSCALWRDGELIARHCPIGRSHSETLLPLVRELLHESALSIGQLDAIAFGVGPGAFTGLRVACGAAQGLAVSADLPLIPITSLETMAAASGGKQVLALLDARMGEIYSASYCLEEAGWALQGEIRVGVPVDIDFSEKTTDWLACGNALRAYPALAERAAEAGLAVLPDVFPSASWVAKLAVPRLLRGEMIDSALAVPLYIRDKVAKTVAERLSEGGKA